jgi:hypothetical protein
MSLSLDGTFAYTSSVTEKPLGGQAGAGAGVRLIRFFFLGFFSN